MMTAASGNKSLLAFDGAFPHRDEVLCADAMRLHLTRLLKTPVESCEIARVKYRPQTSLRVLYRVKNGGETSLLSARVFAEDRGGEVYKNAESEQLVLRDENLKAVFWKFPFDRKITQLEKIAREKNCGKELVAYAPEKCATFKFFNRPDEPFAYAKIFADGDGERVFSTYEGFSKTGEKLFPRAVCFSPKSRTLFVEAVKGARLADLPADDLSDSFRLFGAAIARFHELKTSAALWKFTRHEPQKIEATLLMIEQALPENYVRAARLARALAQKFEPENQEKAILHGDVHAKNAILQPDGRLVLIDLDQTSIGNPASDIGSFLAGLLYKETTREIQAETRKKLSENFLAGYESVRPVPNRKSLNWHTAAAIFTERCGRAVSRFRREGLENFTPLLAVGEEILQGVKI